MIAAAGVLVYGIQVKVNTIVAQRFPPRGARLHHFVVRDITQQLGRGALKPGDLLPNEAELCINFQVSRSVVRDAVRVLAEKGLVDVRPGRGTAVTSVAQWDLLDPMVLEACLRCGRFGAILDEVLELRRIVEVQVAGLAASRATADEVADLGRIVADLRGSVEAPERYAALDDQFHEQLAATVKNSLLLRVARPVFNLIRVGRQMTNTIGLGLCTSQAGHEAIYHAIAAHDPVAARQAMADHIAYFEETMRQALHQAVAGEPALTPTDSARL